LTGLFHIQDILTGGTLRGITISPTSPFLFVTNRELNFLHIIDLRDGSPTFRNVVASITQPVNPVDVELSPDGSSAYTISEFDRELAVNAIGIGATLNALSRIAGPEGSRLALSGLDFTLDAITEVSFDGVMAVPDDLSSSSLSVTVPAGVSDGPVTVVGDDGSGPTSSSNPIFFDIITSTPPGGIRVAGGAQPPGPPDLNAALALSSTRNLAAVGAASSGDVYLADTDRLSPTFNQFFDQVSVPLTQVHDIAVTPDGETAFVVEELANQIPVINIDPSNSIDFKTVVGTVDLSGLGSVEVSRVAASPTGARLLVSDPGTFAVHIVDIEASSAQQYQAINTIPLAGLAGANGVVREMAFHPNGLYGYLPVQDPNQAVILVLDVMAENIVGQVFVPGPSVPDEIPISLSFTPDATRCLVLTTQSAGLENRTLVMLNTTNPVNPTVSTDLAIPVTTPVTPEHVHVSPAGDIAIVNIRDSGYHTVQIQTGPDALVQTSVSGVASHHSGALDFGFAPDASMFLSVSATQDSLFLQDFTEAQDIALFSGDGQAGAVDQLLPAPIRVKVTGAGGTPIPGVPVTFDVTAGGGTFVGTASASQAVITDRDGVAEVEWMLGPDLGTGAHQAEATASDLAGSPVAFTADGVVDPNTLPLEVSDVTPLEGTLNVSITTATLTTFTRAIDPASVGPATFFLHTGDFVAVPVVYGFTDQNRGVSMTPVAPLDPNETYTIEMTTGILDASGGLLDAAESATFPTSGPAPLVLNSINPVSGPVGIPAVLAGTGFDPNPANNTVTFGNDVTGVVTEAGADYLNVTVPPGAATGPVRVDVGASASNTVDFTVLIPQAAPVDDVIGNVGTRTSPRGLAITPDQLRAYALSPDANTVVEIDIGGLSFGATINVGRNPTAIVIDPLGTFAYVANLLSGTVNVINVDPLSADYRSIVATMPVGAAPLDVAIHPDGDRLYVVNGSSDLSIVDTDFSSETFHQVIGNVGSPGVAGSQTISVTPDRVYLGTDNGYVVLSSLDYSVIANVGTGAPTRSLAITPDRTMLTVLTTEGQVVFFDVAVGSATENRVIGNVGGVGAVRSLSITPDQTFAYLVMEEGDVIQVVSLEVPSSVSVIEIPEDAFEFPIVATITTAGEDPSHVAFTSNGEAVVTNAGDNSITILGDLGLGPMMLACPRDTVLMPFGQFTGVVLSGFEISNSSGTILSYSYDVASTGPATLIDNGDPASLSGVTPLLDPGASHTPPPAALWVSPDQTPAQQMVTYRVEVVQYPGTIDSCQTTVTYDGTVPVFILSFEATPGDRGVALSWNVWADEKVQGYKIQRRERGMETFQVLNADALLSPDSREFTDHDVLGGREYDYTLVVVFSDDSEMASRTVTVRARAFALALYQNFPNPFNPTTTISFTLPKRTDTELSVYNVRGQLVRRLVQSSLDEGHNEYVWDAKDSNGNMVSSGIYFYRLKVGKKVLTKKMVLLK
jgi:DNA-binding beta-propeller fold protein YncE